MARPIIDLTGKKFGNWKVLNLSKKRSIHNRVKWKCQCKCGRIRIVLGQSLQERKSNSCGIGKCDYRKHGQSYTPEYLAWRAMLDRCYKPNVKMYKRYGGRGISVCSKWRSSFENFLKDMGQRPSSDYSIDRINNNGNYAPKNCRWATRNQQSNNIRSNRRLRLKNKNHTIAEWSRKFGVSHATICSRLNRGWSTRKTLTVPFNI